MASADSYEHTQRMHRMEVWINRRADGKTGRAFVGDLTEEKSVEMASKLASEGFVFAVSVCQRNYGFMSGPMNWRYTGRDRDSGV